MHCILICTAGVCAVQGICLFDNVCYYNLYLYINYCNLSIGKTLNEL